MSSNFTAKLINLSDTELDYFSAFHKNKKGKVAFIKYLASVKGLYSKKGVCLCTTTLAKALNCSSQTISNYLKTLEKLLVIECVDSSYAAGKYSRKYRGTDSFLYELYQLYAEDDFTSAKVVRFVMRELTMQKARKRIFHQMNTFARKNPELRIPKSLCKQLARLYVGMHDTLKEDLATYLDDTDFWKKEDSLLAKPYNDVRSMKYHRAYYIFYVLRKIYRDLGMRVQFTIRSVTDLISDYDFNFEGIKAKRHLRVEKSLTVMGLYIYDKPEITLKRTDSLGPPT